MEILEGKVQRLRTKANRILLLQDKVASMEIQADDDEDVMKQRMVVNRIMLLQDGGQHGNTS